MREFAACHPNVAISHDPDDGSSLNLVTPEADGVNQTGETLADVRQKRVWIEFVRDGLTFDITGLSPGLSADFPQILHRFDLKKIPEQSDYEVLHLTPGHHLAGGEQLIPIAQSLLRLARDLVDHFDELDCVVWPPAASAIGHQFFESIVTAWLDGGPFPALGLTAFHETVDGALQSEGLDFWIGQEVRIEPPLSADKVTATRLGVRLINQLVLVGGIDQSERVVAPDGTNLVMRTSRNGKFVRVWRE